MHDSGASAWHSGTVSLLTRIRPAKESGLVAPARVERDLPDFSHRHKRGEIVVLDQRDLDRVTAERLVERQVAAVINASASITGRYPNQGPAILAEADILIVDFVGPEILEHVSDGDKLRIDAGKVYKGEQLVASGAVLDRAYVRKLVAEAQSGVSTQVQNLAANAAEQLRREQALYLDGAGIPKVPALFEGRPAVVVDRAFDVDADLAGLKRFIKNADPVLVGAGRGADVLLDAGHRLDLVIGEAEDISARALRESQHVVLIGDAVTRESTGRLEKAGKEAHRIAAAAPAADLAMLTAAANEAAVVVAVGAPVSLIEFLDRPQTDMAGSLLTRMRLAGALVDAKAVRALGTTRSHIASSLALVAAGFVAVGAAIATTQTGAEWWDAASSAGSSAITWIRGLFA